MKSLSKVAASPSALDSSRNYIGDDLETFKDWQVVLARTRDSDCLTESNWEVALERLGGESETVKIFNFGHWAVGWIEYLCVLADTEAEQEGWKIENDIDDYPILDEEDFSNKETEEANYIWQNCYNVKDRIKYMRSHKDQFEFHDFSDIMGCVRGKYFAGYASELLW